MQPNDTRVKHRIGTKVRKQKNLKWNYTLYIHINIGIIYSSSSSLFRIIYTPLVVFNGREVYIILCIIIRYRDERAFFCVVCSFVILSSLSGLCFSFPSSSSRSKQQRIACTRMIYDAERLPLFSREDHCIRTYSL